MPELIAWIGIALLIGLICSAFLWFPPRRRPRSPEEAVEAAALRAEQDRDRTRAIEHRDRIQTGRR